MHNTNMPSRHDIYFCEKAWRYKAILTTGTMIFCARVRSIVHEISEKWSCILRNSFHQHSTNSLHQQIPRNSWELILASLHLLYVPRSLPIKVSFTHNPHLSSFSFGVPNLLLIFLWFEFRISWNDVLWILIIFSVGFPSNFCDLYCM